MFQDKYDRVEGPAIAQLIQRKRTMEELYSAAAADAL